MCVGESIPFFGVHIAALLGVLVIGWSWSGLLLAVAFYYLRMFAITAGYHRYFAHRSFKTGRVVQFLFALFGTLAVQQGALFWAGHHRTHHKHSDQPGDVHSPRLDGFYWAHMGWFLAAKHKRREGDDWKQIPDFARFPELRWLDQHHLIPVVTYAVLMFLVAGWWGLIWGFFVSTTLLWHGVFTINSLAHVFGRRRYDITDDSRNNWVLALITMGEGWHNNHHYYQRSASQGFYWWEVDFSYYLLRGMQAIGLVSGVSGPPREVRDRRPVLGEQGHAEGQTRQDMKCLPTPLALRRHELRSP